MYSTSIPYIVISDVVRDVNDTRCVSSPPINSGDDGVKEKLLIVPLVPLTVLLTI